jgi:hypothetical protein
LVKIFKNFLYLALGKSINVLTADWSALGTKKNIGIRLVRLKKSHGLGEHLLVARESGELLGGCKKLID